MLYAFSYLLYQSIEIVLAKPSALWRVKQYEYISILFWRLEVQNQGFGRFVLFCGLSSWPYKWLVLCCTPHGFASMHGFSSSSYKDMNPLGKDSTLRKALSLSTVTLRGILSSHEFVGEIQFNTNHPIIINQQLPQKDYDYDFKASKKAKENIHYGKKKPH